MSEEKKSLPGMAGITSYDVNPERVKLKPSHVVGVLAALVIIEAVLFFTVPL